MTNEQMSPKRHYECSLEQADGKFDFEHGVNNGDSTDLFQAGENSQFADSTFPSSRWWDGKSSGLKVYNISPAGQSMTFSASI